MDDDPIFAIPRMVADLLGEGAWRGALLGANCCVAVFLEVADVRWDYLGDYLLISVSTLLLWSLRRYSKGDKLGWFEWLFIGLILACIIHGILIALNLPHWAWGRPILLQSEATGWF